MQYISFEVTKKGKKLPKSGESYQKGRKVPKKGKKVPKKGKKFPTIENLPCTFYKTKTNVKGKSKQEVNEKLCGRTHVCDKCRLSLVKSTFMYKNCLFPLCQNMLATAPHPVLVFIRQRNTTVFAEKCLHNF
jgi:hypothetical protein